VFSCDLLITLKGMITYELSLLALPIIYLLR